MDSQNEPLLGEYQKRWLLANPPNSAGQLDPPPEQDLEVLIYCTANIYNGCFVEGTCMDPKDESCAFRKKEF
jgi:hypothetical protein